MKKVVAIAVFSCVLVALFVWRQLPTSHAEYISRISGIVIPSGSKQVAAEEFDWGVVAHYQLPYEKKDEFRRAHSFGSFSKLHDESPMKIDYLSVILGRARPELRKTEGIVALRGRTKTNAWGFVLEPATSSLWVVVEFPDMSGDLP